MKQLTCEMCGSTDLTKQDGVFVCQSCGTKYSVEEARKLMIEGTVDVTGSTVKVDTSAELKNLYQIARRAKDDNNGENATKYYDMILVKDPTSWEAAFYVVYFKAMECKIAQIKSAAISVSNCEDSVLFLIKNHVPKSEQLAAVKEIVYRSSRIAHMLANGAKNHYDGIDSDIRDKYLQEYVDNASAARDILYTCGTQIDRIWGDDPQIGKLAAEAWKDGIEIHKQLLPYFANQDIHNQIIDSYTKKCGKYIPDYLNYLKKKLENDISSLKYTISDLSNWDGNTTETKFLNGCGIFIIASSIALSLFLYNFSLSTDGFSLLPILCCIVSIPCFLAAKMKVQENLSENEISLANAKKELDKKEKELRELRNH